MSQLEKVTRIATIANAFLDLPLIIAAGIEVNKHTQWRYIGYNLALYDDGAQVAIWFGFIPLAFSVGNAIWYLRRQQKAANRISTVLDLLTFCGYLTVLIIVWIRDKARLYNAPETLVLDTYATVPLILNMFIHLLYTLRDARPYVMSLGRKCHGGFKFTDSECPHCHRDIHSAATPSMVEAPRREMARNGEGYSLLGDHDDDVPRLSEETVPEVMEA